MKTFEERMKETYAIAAKEIEEEKMFKGYKIVKKNKIAEFGKKALIWCYDNRTMIWASIAGSMMGLNIALNKENTKLNEMLTAATELSETNARIDNALFMPWNDCEGVNLDKATLFYTSGEPESLIECTNKLIDKVSEHFNPDTTFVTGAILAVPIESES